MRTHLSEQSHEARGRNHTDLSNQCLSYSQPALLFAAAFWVNLQRDRVKEPIMCWI